MAKKLKLRKRLFKNKLAMGVVVVLFAGVGVFALINSLAATTFGTAWFQFRTSSGQVINGGAINIYDTPQSSTTCTAGQGTITIGGSGGVNLVNDGNGNFSRSCQVSTIGGTTNTYSVSGISYPSGYQYAGGYTVGSQFTICLNKINCSTTPNPMVIVVSAIPAPPPPSAPHGAAYIGAACSDGRHATGAITCAYNTPITADWNGTDITACKLIGNNQVWHQWGGETSGTYKTGNLTSSVNIYMSCQDAYGTVNSGVMGVTIGSAPPTVVSAKITKFLASPTTVPYGGTSKIGWASSYATTCKLYQGSKLIYSSAAKTITTSKLYGTTGFTLKCYNSGNGANNTTVGDQRSLTVKVTAPASTGTGTHTSSVVSAPRVSSSSSSVAAADSQPPTAPGNLVASQDGPTSVDLTWDASSDNTNVASYVVERSANQKSWSQLSNSVTDTNYSDTDIDFNAHYYYRVYATDDAGNTSDAALADITTQGFEANVKKDEDTSIKSDDGFVEAAISAGTFDEDASCEIVKNNPAQVAPKGLKLAAGAYSLTCKNSNADELTTYNNAIEFTVDLKSLKSFSDLKVYKLDDISTSPLSAQFDSKNKTFSFSQDEAQAFAVYGSKSGHAWWFWILWPALIIGAIALLVVYRNSRSGGATGYDPMDYYSVPAMPQGPPATVVTSDPNAYPTVPNPGYPQYPSLPEMVAQQQAQQQAGQAPQNPQNPQQPQPPAGPGA